MSILMSTLVQDAHEQHALSKCNQLSFSEIHQDAHEIKECRLPSLNLNRFPTEFLGQQISFLAQSFLFRREKSKVRDQRQQFQAHRERMKLFTNHQHLIDKLGR
jgi:hypothetical protein